MDARFLPFVDGELLQLLLVGVAETGDVDVCEAAAEAVHFALWGSRDLDVRIREGGSKGRVVARGG